MQRKTLLPAKWIKMVLFPKCFTELQIKIRKPSRLISSPLCKTTSKLSLKAINQPHFTNFPKVEIFYLNLSDQAIKNYSAISLNDSQEFIFLPPFLFPVKKHSWPIFQVFSKIKYPYLKTEIVSNFTEQITAWCMIKPSHLFMNKVHCD